MTIREIKYLRLYLYSLYLVYKKTGYLDCNFSTGIPLSYSYYLSLIRNYNPSLIKLKLSKTCTPSIRSPIIMCGVSNNTPTSRYCIHLQDHLKDLVSSVSYLQKRRENEKGGTRKRKEGKVSGWGTVRARSIETRL